MGVELLVGVDGSSEAALGFGPIDDLGEGRRFGQRLISPEGMLLQELCVLVEEQVHLVLGVVVALLRALGALLILFRWLVIHEMITNKFVSALLIYLGEEGEIYIEKWRTL